MLLSECACFQAQHCRGESLAVLLLCLCVPWHSGLFVGRPVLIIARQWARIPGKSRCQSQSTGTSLQMVCRKAEALNKVVMEQKGHSVTIV